MSEAHKEVMAEKLLELEARLLGELNQDTRAGLKNGSLATGRKERGLRGKEVEGN